MPELSQLRIQSHSWTAPSAFTVTPGRPFPVPSAHGASLEVSLWLAPSTDATVAASLTFRSEAGASAQPVEDAGEGGKDECPSDYCSLAVTVSWERATLEVLCRAFFPWRTNTPFRRWPFSTLAQCLFSLNKDQVHELVFGLVIETSSAHTSYCCCKQVSGLRHIHQQSLSSVLDDPAREVGGLIDLPRGESVQLRVFLDHSALEVRHMHRICIYAVDLSRHSF